MSKTTTNLLLMLFTIIIGTYAFVTFCSDCHAETNPIPLEVEANLVPLEKEKTVSNAGLTESKITSLSKDSDNAKASNTTKEGLAENSNAEKTLNN